MIPKEAVCAEAIKVHCESCEYQDLCVYRRVVQDAVRSVASALCGDDWAAGDDPVVTALDISECARYNPK